VDFFWVFLVSEFLGGKVGLLCYSIFNDIGRRVIICDCRRGFVLYRGINGETREKKAAVSAVSIANARRCSDVEYARILESPMEVVEMAVENSWALWCYDGKF